MPDWNERYLAGTRSPENVLPLILEAAGNYPAGNALDLACGLGRHALCLAEHGWRVTAVDSSEVAIGRLRKASRDRSLEIESKVMDLETTGLNLDLGGYDLICDCLYLQRSLVARIHSRARPGGLIAFALPMIDDTPGIRPMNPGFLVAPGEVRSWFADWDIIEYREERCGGERKLAQLLARKPLRVEGCQ